MDTKQNRTVALLSIHPAYAERLLEGSKCVELRKTRLAREIDYVIIYSTSPVQKVVGYFSVAKVAIGLPKAIWSEYKHVAGIESRDFIQYYEGAKQAVAIEVEQMHKLSCPVPLSVLGAGLKPPQSFQYLDISTIERLNEYKPSNERCAA